MKNTLRKRAEVVEIWALYNLDDEARLPTNVRSYHLTSAEAEKAQPKDQIGKAMTCILPKAALRVGCTYWLLVKKKPVKFG